MCFVTERKLRNSGSAYSTNAKGTGKTQEWTRLTWIANHNHGKLSLNCPRLTSHGVQVAPLTIPNEFNDTKNHIYSIHFCLYTLHINQNWEDKIKYSAKFVGTGRIF